MDMAQRSHRATRGVLAVVALLAMLLNMACDELSKEDGGISEVVQGTWSFTYEIKGDLGLAFSYEHVIFNADGTCAITYPDGALHGTYQAGNGFIRIDSDETLNAKPMMWRILSFAPYRVSAEYILELEDRDVLITICLEKVV